MKRVILSALLASIFISLPTGCQTSAVPPLMDVSYNGKLSEEPVLVQIFSVGDAGDEAVKDAIIRAATVRGWEVNDLGDLKIQTKLVHRSADSTLIFEYGDSRVNIYSVSYKINKNSQVRIERAEPEGWIRNLHKDILENLGLIPTS